VNVQISGGKSATETKAGKKHRYQAPPAPNPENAERREAGERQFTLNRPATVESANLMGKVVAEPVPFAWCPFRKQVLYSPGRKAAS
jgi:hypothetical protein